MDTKRLYHKTNLPRWKKNVCYLSTGVQQSTVFGNLSRFALHFFKCSSGINCGRQMALRAEDGFGKFFYTSNLMDHQTSLKVQNLSQLNEAAKKIKIILKFHWIDQKFD